MDLLILISSITLINLPLIDPTEFKLMSLFKYFILWVIILKNIIARYALNPVGLSINANKYRMVLFLIFISLFIAAYFKALVYSVMTFQEILKALLNWMTIVLFIFSFFLSHPNKQKRIQIQKCIFFSLAMYVVINVCLSIAGFENPNIVNVGEGITPSRLGGIFGLDLYRKQMPLSSGLNSFGIISGIVMLSSMLVVTTSRFKLFEKLIAIVFFACAFYGILVVDSRTNFVLTFITFLLIKSIPLKKISALHYIPLLSPILIFVLVFAIMILPQDLVVFFSRNSDLLSMYTFSNRVVIWHNAINSLGDFSIAHFLGYGMYGHVRSGVSEAYAATLFKGWINLDPVKYSLHNFSLQLIFDIGYCGLIFVIFYLSHVILHLSRSLISYKSPIYLLNLSVLIFMIFAGSTSVAGTIYHRDVFIIMIFIFVSALFDRDDHSKGKSLHAKYSKSICH